MILEASWSGLPVELGGQALRHLGIYTLVRPCISSRLSHSVLHLLVEHALIEIDLISVVGNILGNPLVILMNQKSVTVSIFVSEILMRTINAHSHRVLQTILTGRLSYLERV